MIQGLWLAILAWLPMQAIWVADSGGSVADPDLVVTDSVAEPLYIHVYKYMYL